MTSGSASRVTRSRRSLQLALLLLGGMLAVAGVLRAQEPQAQTKATTESTESAESAENTEAAEAPEGAAADEVDSTPPPKGPSPSRFEPTEKVRADFDVSFPVDI